MEKDYFCDRPEERTKRYFFDSCTEAFICLKENQKSAKELKDLTRIYITRKLTPQQIHPRGIKLKGISYERDIYGNYLVNDDMTISQKEAIGRCTYPIVGGKVLTRDGLKYISADKACHLIDIEEISSLYNFELSLDSRFFSCKCIVNPYKFYAESNLSSVLSDIDLENIFTNGLFVYFSQQGTAKASDLYGAQFSSPYVSSINAALDMENSNFIRLKPVSFCGII